MPQGIPLRGMQVPWVAQALVCFFSRVGLPQKILTGRGATFMSALMKQLCQTLGIHQLFTTIHHPQTDGLVEWMNQTIKDMLRKTAGAFQAQLDKYLDPLLFALREKLQASMRLAPFELVWG